MPIISVVVPIYNMESTLSRCVDSIIDQSFSDFELILVDDGSTDSSAEICDKYHSKDNRIKVIHKENGGVASAKNMGISVSNGEYITFVDSDDFLDADCFDRLVSANCCDYDMIISGVKYVCSDSLACYAHLDFFDSYSFENKDFAEHTADLLEQRALNYHVAKLYKRKILTENNIIFTDFNKTGADDTVFNFEVYSKSQRIMIVNYCGYNYVNYSNSTSHRFSENLFARRKALDSFLMQKTSEMGLLDKKLQKIIDKRFVMASLWSASSCATCGNLSYRKYLSYFNEICCDNRFREAYLSVKNTCSLDRGVDLIYQKHALKFYRYANDTLNKIKGSIYKYIPGFIKKAYKHLKG